MTPFCDSRLAAIAMREFARVTSPRALEETARAAGLAPDVAEGPPLFLPYARCAFWLELAARRLGERHFGALVGRATDYCDQGPYARYVLEAPTLLRALARGRLALPFVANAARVDGRREGDHFVVSYRHGMGDVLGARHVDEHFPLLATDLVRRFLGPDWRPGWIELPANGRPPGTALIESYDGCDLRIAKAAGIAIPIAQLQAPNAEPPAAVERLTLHDLAALTAGGAPMGFEDTVRQAIRLGLRAGNASAEAVAARLDIGVRTLQRRLQADGLSFRDLRLDECLTRGAALLRDSDLTINQIARALGYDEPRSFRRAFHARFGHSPSRLRAAALDTESAATRPDHSIRSDGRHDLGGPDQTRRLR